MLRFDVTDTGIGITPAQVDLLFGAFQQADSSTTRKFGGSGLGLRISRSLARMLGGDITASSEPGRGSTFTVTIAAHALSVPAAPPVPPRQGFMPPGTTLPSHPTPSLPSVKHGSDPKRPTDLSPLAGLRIFLAEDGPDNQRLIALHLTRAGATLQLFDDGLHCLKALTTTAAADGPLHNPPPCDLLLADMQMPEMDGYTLARTLRQRGSTLPIVALTANAMAEDRATCLAAGCDDYATKPIDRQQLLDKCAAWARNSRGTTAGTNHS
jgi:CheY-like chemotaxis protein